MFLSHFSIMGVFQLLVDVDVDNIDEDDDDDDDDNVTEEDDEHSLQ